MNYKEIVSESFGIQQKHITVDKGENIFHSFPVDNSNSNYIFFLRQLSQENPEDPHYVAWVEAGNNLEDFWTQDEEI